VQHNKRNAETVHKGTVDRGLSSNERGLSGRKIPISGRYSDKT